ncbi:MAG: hypothetical protein OXC26_16950 [Albidovulum sp.]|nr:hypothetical protein [Albidovulum sp.]
MSGLNGSAGSRRAPVVRSADEWSGIMADFERSGLSQREFCEFRGLSPKSFSNWRFRLRPRGWTGSFVELAPPVSSGWDVELDLGDGVVLRVRRLAAGRHLAVDGSGQHAAQFRRSVRTGVGPSGVQSGGHGYRMDAHGLFSGRGFWALVLLWLPACRRRCCRCWPAC